LLDGVCLNTTVFGVQFRRYAETSIMAKGEIITAQFGPGTKCPKCGRPEHEHRLAEWMACFGVGDHGCKNCQRPYEEHTPSELAVCNDALYDARAPERTAFEELFPVVCFGFLAIMALLHPEPLFVAWRVLTH
jgi:hypothetical protein